MQETWGKNETIYYSIKGDYKPEIRARSGNMNSGSGVGIWITDDIEFENIKSPTNYLKELVEQLMASGLMQQVLSLIHI